MLSRFLLLLILMGTFFALPLSPTLALSESQQDAAIAALQSAVASLQSTVSSQAATIAAQQKTINDQKSLLSGFSRVTDTTRADKKKGTELYLTGFNLHVVNGLGATNGDPNNTGTTAVNGLGNIVIGYNGSRAVYHSTDTRTGSHNLIVGDRENYTSFGGIVIGSGNTLTGPYASVSGGTGNTASGMFASVSGGSNNTASGNVSSVSGGTSSTATGTACSVSGGALNTAGGFNASVSGGSNNTANASNSTVSGGYYVQENDLNGFAAGGQYTQDALGPGVFHSP